MSFHDLIAQEYGDDDDDDDKEDEVEDSDNDNENAFSNLNHISATEGLSATALAALLEFQAYGYFEDEEENQTKKSNNDDAQISSETLCVAYTAKDNQVIADTMKRLKKKDDAATFNSEKHLANRKILDLEPTEGFEGPKSTSFSRAKAAALVLKTEGVVRINNIVSADLCNRCLDEVQKNLDAGGNIDFSEGTDNKSSGYGNVFSRKNRYDMYLRNEGVFNEVLHSLLGKETVLALLFDILLSGHSGKFHEFSSLVSEPGSSCQPIHPDTAYTEEPQLYTCFLALQDITEEMGPTHFLPRTHTRICHDSHRATDESRYEFLGKCEYRQGLLRKGDVSLMDSRTMHYGGANVTDQEGLLKKQRVLLYFTIRNPFHSKTGRDEDYTPNGSIWPDLKMSTHDFL